MKVLLRSIRNRSARQGRRPSAQPSSTKKNPDVFRHAGFRFVNHLGLALQRGLVHLGGCMLVAHAKAATGTGIL